MKRAPSQRVELIAADSADVETMAAAVAGKP